MDQVRRITEAVASYREAMLELTKVLVAIPTENPPGRHYRQCVDTIRNALADIERCAAVYALTAARMLAPG